jgi:hypothetical protein
MIKTKTLVVAALLMVGCREITYTSPTGARIEYRNTLFDTKAGLIDADLNSGKVRIEQLDASSRALIVAEKALDKVRP